MLKYGKMVKIAFFTHFRPLSQNLIGVMVFGVKLGYFCTFNVLMKNDGIYEKIEQKKKIIKGPKIDAPQAAIDGFIQSNNLNKKDVYKKRIEKGE